MVSPYITLVNEILQNGEERTDRTGTGTISLFGTQSVYNLVYSFPLDTSRYINFSAVVAELLWFLSGSTNTKDLDAKIWNAWAREDGDVGPLYGNQWRSWGGRGYDQLQQAVELIQHDPHSRRILVSAWNVEDLPRMVLAPCHVMFQFYVTTHGQLDCQVYQRSADVMVGVPFNVASYALLTYIVAKQCRLEPGRLIHTIGDAHIYKDHIAKAKEQVLRSGIRFPTLFIEDHVTIDSVTKDDIKLAGYYPHRPVRYPVAV